MNSRVIDPRRLGLMLGLLLTGLAGAAQPPGGQPVEVSADSATFEQSAGTGVYRGNAEMIQGNRHLYADVIRLFTENNELVRVEATGNPVRMKEGKELQARASNLVYDLTTRRLVLTGDAHVDHQGNTFEGARVEYNLDSRRVDASSEGDKRVRLVIPAKNTGKAGDTDDEQPATDGDAGGSDNQQDQAETP
ncbi:lipopolysaccharide transport periplasmic protein LptA [Alloalcanivorax sp. C16-2]|uniref:lipopolysaccharide transport periplasmic protein LptA n=1 Tax=Alloalcanivorax sp. C16-2 TaxID=3390052 RepID=UPI003970AA5A